MDEEIQAQLIGLYREMLNRLDEMHLDYIYGPCWRCEGMGV